MVTRYAQEIAYVNTSGKDHTQFCIKEFISFVRDTDDVDIMGLTTIMAEEIQMGRYLKGEYLGGKSCGIDECYKDAQFLLARVLFEKSSILGKVNLDLIKKELNVRAFSIYENDGNQDSMKNWVRAETIYVKGGLLHLEELLKEDLPKFRHFLPGGTWEEDIVDRQEFTLGSETGDADIPAAKYKDSHHGEDASVDT